MLQTKDFNRYVLNMSIDLNNCINAINRGDKNPYLLKIRTNLENKLNDLEQTEKEYNSLFL